jgi:hypothetical protein
MIISQKRRGDYMPRTRDLFRSQGHYPYMRKASGEREEIGRIRKAGRLAAEAVERSDPEGGKSPGGEWRPQEQSGEPHGGAATGSTQRNRRLTGANRERRRSGRSERAVWTGGRERSSRPGTLTPGWRLREGAAVTGERKAVTSDRP